MNHHESKSCVLQFLLLCCIGFVSSTGKDASVWQDIVSKATDIARGAGVPRAGEPCLNFGEKDKTCLVQIDDGEFVQVPILECNLLVGIGDIGAGVCQVKSWILYLSLALIIVIPLGLLWSICCFCRAYC